MATGSKSQVKRVETQTRVTQRANPLGKQKAPEPPQPRLVNRICLILDESGSMQSLASKVVEFANQQLTRIKLEAATTKQITELSILKFSDAQQWLYQNVYHEGVGLLTYQDYRPGGQTALLDAVDLAVLGMKAKVSKPGDDLSYLVIVLTDGQENHSRRVRVHDFQRLLSEHQGTDRWTFAFMGPRGSRQYLQSLGVPPGNIEEWDQTEAELDRVGVMMAAGASSYYANRAVGRSSMNNLFTNVGNLKLGTVASKLDDVTHQYKTWKVEKGEVQIKDFVESKRFNYLPGHAFYQLTKTEEVQPQKDVVLKSNQDGKLYGGQEARKMIGLPEKAPGVHVRVKPGNHGDWKIFVRSDSTNRKLVRGTEVLYKLP